MLVIKFAIRGSKITWFVNDNWIMFISFLLTMVTGLGFRKIKNSNKKIKITNLKVGDFIDKCINPDSIYELVDPTLEIVVRQMLKTIKEISLNFPPPRSWKIASSILIEPSRNLELI